MTDTLTPPATALPQERRLVTEIPGPRSRELMQRRVGAVSAGVGGTMPVFAERAGGGVIVDVDSVVSFGGLRTKAFSATTSCAKTHAMPTL